MFWLPCMLWGAALVAKTLRGVVQPTAGLAWAYTASVPLMLIGLTKAHLRLLTTCTRLPVGHCGGQKCVHIQDPMSQPLTLCAPAHDCTSHVVGEALIPEASAVMLGLGFHARHQLSSDPNLESCTDEHGHVQPLAGPGVLRVGHHEAPKYVDCSLLALT